MILIEGSGTDIVHVGPGTETEWKLHLSLSVFLYDRIRIGQSLDISADYGQDPRGCCSWNVLLLPGLEEEEDDGARGG